MDKKEFFFSWLVLLALSLFGENVAAQKKGERLQWENGRLVVSEEGRYLKHENGMWQSHRSGIIRNSGSYSP